mmetsp:Transcript_88312/g.263383  ORF Transcript_88312/g.263383 Transcript_88312/m.263383 type:complete len:311 (+) Transcript_88312:1918-2850(+)
MWRTSSRSSATSAPSGISGTSSPFCWAKQALMTARRRVISRSAAWLSRSACCNSRRSRCATACLSLSPVVFQRADTRVLLGSKNFCNSMPVLFASSRAGGRAETSSKSVRFSMAMRNFSSASLFSRASCAAWTSCLRASSLSAICFSRRARCVASILFLKASACRCSSVSVQSLATASESSTKAAPSLFRFCSSISCKLCSTRFSSSSICLIFSWRSLAACSDNFLACTFQYISLLVFACSSSRFCLSSARLAASCALCALSKAACSRALPSSSALRLASASALRRAFLSALIFRPSGVWRRIAAETFCM